jgi:hypothetical protein
MAESPSLDVSFNGINRLYCFKGYPVSTHKKPKLVRDSFTMPKQEYAAIESLKARSLAAGIAVKKSELLRAGLMALTALNDAALKQALAAVPTLKTGRPATSEAANKAQETPDTPHESKPRAAASKKIAPLKAAVTAAPKVPTPKRVPRAPA